MPNTILFKVSIWSCYHQVQCCFEKKNNLILICYWQKNILLAGVDDRNNGRAYSGKFLSLETLKWTSSLFMVINFSQPSIFFPKSILLMVTEIYSKNNYCFEGMIVMGVGPLAHVNLPSAVPTSLTKHLWIL